MKYQLLVIVFCFIAAINAQSPEELIEKHSFSTSALSSEAFADFFQPRVQSSQFVFVGEQHGIIEAGEVTTALFQIGQPYGYTTLCIETDSLAAKTLEEFHQTGNMLAAAREFDQRFPFSIPFYNNEEDYRMFEKVLGASGQLWGIDQSLMTQFRMNFTRLSGQTNSAEFNKALQPLIEQANDGFKVAMRDKDFTAPYIFKYDEKTHNALLKLANTQKERAVLDDLWTSKAIYAYNFNRQYYLNNEERGRLMKRNFLNYYTPASASEENPRVIFKLGANHAARGLTRTRIYDIANMGAELAIINAMESLHLVVMGISGTQNMANPFNPTAAVTPIDATKMVPERLLNAAQNASAKYFVLDAAALRPQARQFDKATQDIIFAYDLVILVKEARAVTGF